jgi:hypothetical protein
MSELDQGIPQSTDSNSNQLPSMLNVLTILTMIGSGLGLISTVFLKFGCKVLEMDEVVSKMKDADIEILEKTCANITVLMIVGFVSSLLCLMGAFMMRKLKKQGFYIYIIGQLIGILSSPLILGMESFSDYKNWFGYGISVLFIILYATQQKILVK